MTLNGVNIRRYDRGDKQFKILACENGLIGPGRILKKILGQAIMSNNKSPRIDLQMWQNIAF